VKQYLVSAAKLMKVARSETRSAGSSTAVRYLRRVVSWGIGCCASGTAPGRCARAVIGDVLVYRKGSHLTATYVLTLTPWLAEHLPEPAGS
jgi:hypothetical protein